MASKKTKLTSAQQKQLLKTLHDRFHQHPERHPKVNWSDVEARLEKHPEKCWTLQQMEETGGEPDVTGQDKDGAVVFMDCSAESPAGRRSLCYDEQALKSRKENKPRGSAMGMAEEMGMEMLTEEEFHHLQQAAGPMDVKTSSWLRSPDSIRILGGAIFGDYRYGRVFIYHNGAESYYAARGFRGKVKV